MMLNILRVGVACAVWLHLLLRREASCSICSGGSLTPSSPEPRCPYRMYVMPRLATERGRRCHRPRHRPRHRPHHCCRHANTSGTWDSSDVPLTFNRRFNLKSDMITRFLITTIQFRPQREKVLGSIPKRGGDSRVHRFPPTIQKHGVR